MHQLVSFWVFVFLDHNGPLPSHRFDRGRTVHLSPYDYIWQLPTSSQMIYSFMTVNHPSIPGGFFVVLLVDCKNIFPKILISAQTHQGSRPICLWSTSAGASRGHRQIIVCAPWKLQPPLLPPGKPGNPEHFHQPICETDGYRQFCTNAGIPGRIIGSLEWPCFVQKACFAVEREWDMATLPCFLIITISSVSRGCLHLPLGITQVCEQTSCLAYLHC